MSPFRGCLWCLAILTPAVLTAADLRVDCAEMQGRIRPLHGVNGGPLNYGETIDLTRYWREAAIPLARLHDCEWPAGRVVDLHAVFPSLAADPEDPRSYRFAETDEYLKAVEATGAKIVYRLGESIEHSRTKHHVHPPADFDRWAAACLGVIRHYHEGWAGGFQAKIAYWEIWNEPENRPACWTGSDDDYYRLYATTSKAIKTRFPELKIGGPSVGATGDVVDGRLVATPFLQGFIERCREQQLPLDFFSWHTYSDDPEIYGRKAEAIRRWLDEHDYKQTEIHLNEWNYLPGNDWGPLLPAGQGAARARWYAEMGGPRGAAFAAYVLLDLQDRPVDVANFFHGDSSPFGLFTQHGAPRKTYHAFQAFRMLLDTPRRVSATGGVPGKSAIAAGVNENQTELTIVHVSFAGAAEADAAADLTVGHLPWAGETEVEQFRLDGERDLESTGLKRFAGPSIALRLDLAAPAVTVVRLKKSQPPR